MSEYELVATGVPEHPYVFREKPFTEAQEERLRAILREELARVGLTAAPETIAGPVPGRGPA
jgi:hypothetical protein